MMRPFDATEMGFRGGLGVVLRDSAGWSLPVREVILQSGVTPEMVTQMTVHGDSVGWVTPAATVMPVGA
jgi:hypothetical protein